MPESATTEPYKPGTTAVPGFPRITHNQRVMGGKACVRGMRVTVSMILGNLGAGTTIDELLTAYDYLEREDILESLRYAAWLASQREVMFESAA